MKLIKVGAAVLNQTPRDWSGNIDNIQSAICLAREQNITVLCLPEMAITGYGLEDDLFCADVPRRALLKLEKIAKLTNGMIVSVGLPILFNNTLYNAVATIVNQIVVGFTCKQHLASDGIHYESRHFKPWPRGVVQYVEMPDLQTDSRHPTEIPIGDVHFNIGGIKFGYEICEDAWVANRPGTILSTKGVDVYLNPSASHFSFGKLNTRKNFVVDGSRAFNATYIYTNLVGNEAGRAIYDGGALIASGGTLVAAGPRFTYKNVSITSAVVDVHNTRTSQVRSASFQPDVEQYNTGCMNVEFYHHPVKEQVTTLAPSVQSNAWENSHKLKHEECVRALGLSLMDYMRKSHTKGFVVSLSGGADSAMVTYLCVAGIRLAVKELRMDQFIHKYCPHLEDADILSVDELIKKLVTTAYQATAQSGEVTRKAAFELAFELGTKHFEFNVEPMVQEYLKIGERVQGTPMTFKTNDLALQNLQARSRSPGIWIIANMEGKLLLTTSNMSEAAVGYCTMDGDTSGCVAPIGGLSKVYIKEFLRWAEQFGSDARMPIESMVYVNKQEPTAELRPKECLQTDEKDLMPYDLLHQIETMVVKNRYTPIEIFQALKDSTSNDINNTLIKHITKFFRLFSINQWKRERYALSFHMDDHNLDPRTWCRTPILTGGYEEELGELEALIK